MFSLHVAISMETRGMVLLTILTCVSSLESSRFENELSLNDLRLFEEFSLGPSSNKSRDHCAQDCHWNPRCTVFSITLGADVCQLYGDVVYPDVATASHMPAQRYFVYMTGLRLQGYGFIFLRKSQLNIRISDNELDYNDSVAYCEGMGARLIVLEEEDKATAVTEFLQKIGAASTMFFLGTRVEGSHPNFVWVDGQLLSRDWWRDGEPNNSGEENCVSLKENRMLDIECSRKFKFICEIPQ